MAALLVNPLDSSAEVVAQGKALYGRFCSHCHGDNGTEPGLVGEVLGGVTSYTSMAVVDKPGGHIFHVITMGKGRMGSHASQLSPEERWQIVRYVQVLQKTVEKTIMSDEKYTFRPQTKKLLIILAVVGLALVVIGVMTTGTGGHVEEDSHTMASTAQNLVASVDSNVIAISEEAGEESHGSPTWLKRLYANLWMNNVYFTGLAIIGLCFIAIQYAASAGWSAPIKRIPLAMASWLPIAAILMIVVWFLGNHDIFHWTHTNLYGEGGDKILKGKQAYFFWPLTGESGKPVFFLARMIIFFGLWYMFFIWIKKEMLAEDLDGDTRHWFKLRKLSAIFPNYLWR